MDPAGLRSFARRDWGQIAEAKTAFWLEQKRGMPAADVLALGDDLRHHAHSLRPGWPSAEDRAEDLAVHVRVSEALRAVAIRSR